jgi:hypothetical protein
MSEQDFGAEFQPSADAGNAIVIEPRAPGRLQSSAEDEQSARALARFERDQLARDIAEIESAAAALRRAAPALQSWSKPHPPAAAKPRPLWLLIGLLWLSTAIVTVGTVFAIATLAG